MEDFTMKKNFKFYSFGWILLLGLFNLIAFIVPALPDTEKYTASFWIGYSFITVAFIGQFVCTWLALGEKCARKTFYNISLFSTSCAGLIATFVIGSICMIIPPIPYWLAAILCSAILVINIYAFAKAKIAVDYVSHIDEKIEKATSFTYDMREESEAVFARAKDDEAKAICKKVRDAFKFSDPMSQAALNDIEAEIKNHFEVFKAAIREAKINEATAESEELLALISERNSKCKRMK